MFEPIDNKLKSIISKHKIIIQITIILPNNLYFGRK